MTDDHQGEEHMTDNSDELTAAYMLGLHDGRMSSQRTWVGLTDEEFDKCIALANPTAIAEEVEAKLKKKNT